MVDGGFGYTLMDTQAFSGPAIMYGTVLTDYLYGGAFADTFYSYGGNDVVYGYGGNDYVETHNGADTVYGGDGVDTIYGGTENDSLIGENGNDVIYGQDGDDYVVGCFYGWAGDWGADSLYGGNGNDQIYAGWGDDFLFGGEGDDIMAGEDGHDRIFGEGGNDQLIGAYNGSATETGDDFMYGGVGNDRFWGGDGNDIMYGEDGNDELSGENGRDKLFGGWGNDRLWGGEANDRLSGDGGDDTLWGDNGNDELIGGNGTDDLVGGNGDDTLVAIDGWSSDEMWGEAGRDIFWSDAVWINGFPAFDASYTDAADVVQTVWGFANGADRTLDGDFVTDPTDASNIRNFRDNWLFSEWGPTMHDIDQQTVGDCWLMGTMGSIAHDNPGQIRERVADFGDGTYGVRLGDNFYRVDGFLSTPGGGDNSPLYAGLGQQVRCGPPSLKRPTPTSRARTRMPPSTADSPSMP